jgi:pimeloyl-ACP methyl ester carboxylesterase
MKIRSLLAILFLALAASISTLAQGTKPESRWAKLDGNKIHYYDVGGSAAKAKDALILIHGWTCNADFWKDSYNAFPNYRVIALDLPGHGQSDKPKVSYSMDYFARSVEAVMKDAHVKRAVLVGHSMGTPVAREFYRLYPEKTRGIVVVDGALRTFFPKAAGDQFIAQMKANYKASSAQMVDGMLAVVKDTERRQFIRDTMLATPDYVAISAMEGMNDEKIWKEDKINVPVLAVMAPSPFWPANVKETFTSIAPNIDFQMWTGVSHFLFMEKPAEFNEQVRAFIVRNKLL